MGAVFSSRPLHQDRTGAGGRGDCFCQERARAGEMKPSRRYRRARLGQALSLPLWVGQPLQEAPRVPATAARGSPG